MLTGWPTVQKCWPDDRLRCWLDDRMTDWGLKNVDRMTGWPTEVLKMLTGWPDDRLRFTEMLTCWPARLSQTPPSGGIFLHITIKWDGFVLIRLPQAKILSIFVLLLCFPFYFWPNPTEFLYKIWPWNFFGPWIFFRFSNLTLEKKTLSVAHQQTPDEQEPLHNSPFGTIIHQTIIKR